MKRNKALDEVIPGSQLQSDQQWTSNHNNNNHHKVKIILATLSVIFLFIFSFVVATLCLLNGSITLESITRNILSYQESYDWNQKLTDLETLYQELERLAFLPAFQQQLLQVKRHDDRSVLNPAKAVGAILQMVQKYSDHANGYYQDQHRDYYPKVEDKDLQTFNGYFQGQLDKMDKIIRDSQLQLDRKWWKSKEEISHKNYEAQIVDLLYKVIHQKGIGSDIKKKCQDMMERYNLKKKHFVKTWNHRWLNKFFPSRDGELNKHLSDLEQMYNEWTLFNWFHDEKIDRAIWMEKHCQQRPNTVNPVGTVGFYMFQSDDLDDYDPLMGKFTGDYWYWKDSPQGGHTRPIKAVTRSNRTGIRRIDGWMDSIGRRTDPSACVGFWYEELTKRYNGKKDRLKVLYQISLEIKQATGYGGYTKESLDRDFERYVEELNTVELMEFVHEDILTNIQDNIIKQTLDYVLKPKTPGKVKDGSPTAMIQKVKEYKASLNIHDNLDTVIDLNNVIQSYRYLWKLNDELMKDAYFETGDKARNDFLANRGFEIDREQLDLPEENRDPVEFEKARLRQQNEESRTFEYWFPKNLFNKFNEKKQVIKAAFTKLQYDLIQVADEMILREPNKLAYFLQEKGRWNKFETMKIEMGFVKKDEKEKKRMEDPLKLWRRFCRITSTDITKDEYNDITMSDLLEVVAPFITEIVFKISDKTRQKFEPMLDAKADFIGVPTNFEEIERSCSTKMEVVETKNGKEKVKQIKIKDNAECKDAFFKNLPIWWITVFEVVDKTNTLILEPMGIVSPPQLALQAFSLAHLQYVTMFLLMDIRDARNLGFREYIRRFPTTWANRRKWMVEHMTAKTYWISSPIVPYPEYQARNNEKIFAYYNQDDHHSFTKNLMDIEGIKELKF